MKAWPLLACLLVNAASGQVEGLPAAAEPRVMSFAAPREQTMPNGLRVIVVDRPAQPLISAALVVRSGAEADPPDLGGLAHFTAGMLQRGTTLRSAPEIARDLEELGATLECQGTWDGTFAAVMMLAPNAERVFEILADVVCRPKFAPEEFERLQKERVDEARVAFEQPGQVARAAAVRAILGASRYGHFSTGTPASLARIRPADLRAHYASIFRPDRAVLIIVGDVRTEKGFAIAEKTFGSWNSGEAVAAAGSASANPPRPRALLIDVPDAGQAAVYVGCTQPPRSTQPEYYIGQVANAILGGGYSARLNREIRIKRGLSYGSGSRITAWRGAGLFGASCQTKNTSAAEVVGVMQEEIRKLGAEAPAPDELTARRLVLTGTFQRELETNEGYVKRIADFVLHGQRSDTFASTIEGYNRVTAAQVHEFAGNQLAPGRMSVVVVGRASECEKPLRKLLPTLRVISRDEVDFDSATLTGAKPK